MKEEEEEILELSRKLDLSTAFLLFRVFEEVADLAEEW